MTLEAKLKSLLQTSSCPAVMGSYLGSAERYITYDFTAAGGLFGDDDADCIRYLVEVIYTAPIAENVQVERKRIHDALRGAGFSYPEVYRDSRVYDDALVKKQQWVFECEIIGGTDWEVE